jgi:dodecin
MFAGVAERAASRHVPSVPLGIKQGGALMSIARVTEITAASNTGLEDAIRNGIARADKTLEKIEGAWVQQITLKCEDGEIKEWRVNMKVTFLLKDTM